MVDINIQLPDSFFEEEERWGFKIKKEYKELWAVELDLLCEFDRVCKKLGLKYFLYTGTLLGAVRDHHFIPWDDDIDVVMLRDDYDELIKYGASEFKQPFFLQNAYTDPDYRRGLSQLRRSDTAFILTREIEKDLPFNQGICIDIFVLDGFPAGAELGTFVTEKQIIRKQIGDMARQQGHDPVLVRELFRKYENWCSQYRDSEYVELIMHRRNVETIAYLKREWFSAAEYTEFEGLLLPIPCGWDGILTQYYGKDYMTPKCQPTEHGEIIWDVDTSYTSVMEQLRLRMKGSAYM